MRMNGKIAVAVLFKFLKELKVPVSKTSIREELEKYRKAGTLSDIAIILKEWRVTAEVKKVTLPDLLQYHLPLITLFQGALSLVLKNDQNNFVVSSDQLDNEVFNTQDFGKFYTGSILVASKGSKSGERDYRQNRRKELITSLRMPVVVFGSITLLLSFVLSRHEALILTNLRILLLFVITFAGAVITLLLLLQNINANNPLIQRFCGSDKEANCNAVLSSDAAMITNEFSWSEAGFFYFTGNLLILCLDGDLNVIKLLALLNILCLPYTFYSIYYQWRIVKQWCVFCCIVQLILWLQFTFFLALLHHILLPDLKELTIIATSFAVPVFFWIVIKPFLIASQELSMVRMQLNSLKYSRQLFNKLLEEEGENRPLLTQDETMIFGNANPETIVSLVVNPYCGHCARVYRKINRWLRTRPDISLQIIFSTGGDQQKKLLAGDMISIYLTNGKYEAKKALTTWFRLKKRSYGLWRKEFKTVQHDTAAALIEKQAAWCRSAHIAGTPVVFVNGFRLPEIYQVSDLKYLV